MGQTTPGSRAIEFIAGEGRMLGAATVDGRIAGTYMHGVLNAGEFRSAYLSDILGLRGPRVDHLDRINTTLDTVAEALESCLDIEALWRASET